MTKLKMQDTMMQLLAMGHLFFGFAFSQTTTSTAAASSTSAWPLQTFITKVCNLPIIFRKKSSCGIFTNRKALKPDLKVPWFLISEPGEPTPGYIFLNTDTNGVLDENLIATIITNEGQLVWSAGQTGTTDVSLQTYAGENVIVYWEGVLSGVIGRGYGSVIILNTNYEVLYNVSLTEDIFYPDGTLASYIDAHEAQISADNTLLVSAYNVTQADLTSVGYTEQSWILDSVVFEIDVATNEVLWSWAASDHTDQLPFTDSHYPVLSAPTDDEDWWDWFHINAIEEYGEGYLISSRHLWSVIYISKSTGEVIWRLDGKDGGNFTLPAEADFKWQHDPRVLSTSDSGLTITLFNNNNFEYGKLLKSNTSTGLEIALDTTTWTATLNADYYDPDDTITTVAQGSYQTLPDGHVLLDYGLQPQMIEYDADGTVAWSAVWGIVGQGSYRGLKANFTGTPHYGPDLAVTQNPNGTFTAYMSWNGATHYSSWSVHGCGASGSVQVVRTGFETSYTGTCSKTVQAKALDSNGAVMGTSQSVIAGSSERLA
ncbi:hypothetical protein VMCG_08490 [Cytospora schulzeri]|uniref:ASST-domain-containing protein n=1 Tax=Cytospora schulzeri TaxID=448051 RepID=A0A423VWU2_9PEZI|nr:hypothetical protein VMCG_08490 [Valsa malicola]